MPFVIRDRKVLGEGICYHVEGRTVHQAHDTGGYAIAESVNSVVNVLGAVIGHGVLAHHPATAIVVVEWCRRRLLAVRILEDTAKPEDLV